MGIGGQGMYGKQVSVHRELNQKDNTEQDPNQPKEEDDNCVGIFPGQERSV